MTSTGTPWTGFAPPPPPQPGYFPLRPLTVGEILLCSVRIAWRNLALLAPIALIITLVAVGLELAILHWTGELGGVASGAYLKISANPTPAQTQVLFGHVRLYLLAALASLAVTSVGQLVLGARAAALAGYAALNKGAGTKGLSRLKGRWSGIIGAGLLYPLIIAVGLVLLIVPGILAAIWLQPTVNVAAMEGSAPRATLRRTLALSKGYRPRIFGVTLLATLLAGLATFVPNEIISTALNSGLTTRGYVVVQLISTIFGAVVACWTVTVAAMLYIDIRMRKEGLDHSLRGAATGELN